MSKTMGFLERQCWIYMVLVSSTLLLQMLLITKSYDLPGVTSQNYFWIASISTSLLAGLLFAQVVTCANILDHLKNCLKASEGSSGQDFTWPQNDSGLNMKNTINYSEDSVTVTYQMSISKQISNRRSPTVTESFQRDQSSQTCGRDGSTRESGTSTSHESQSGQSDTTSVSYDSVGVDCRKTDSSSNSSTAKSPERPGTVSSVKATSKESPETAKSTQQPEASSAKPNAQESLNTKRNTKVSREGEVQRIKSVQEKDFCSSSGSDTHNKTSDNGSCTKTVLTSLRENKISVTPHRSAKQRSGVQLLVESGTNSEFVPDAAYFPVISPLSDTDCSVKELDHSANQIGSVSLPVSIQLTKLEVSDRKQTCEGESLAAHPPYQGFTDGSCSVQAQIDSQPETPPHTLWQSPPAVNRKVESESNLVIRSLHELPDIFSFDFNSQAERPLPQREVQNSSAPFKWNSALSNRCTSEPHLYLGRKKSPGARPKQLNFNARLQNSTIYESLRLDEVTGPTRGRSHETVDDRTEGDKASFPPRHRLGRARKSSKTRRRSYAVETSGCDEKLERKLVYPNDESGAGSKSETTSSLEVSSQKQVYNLNPSSN